MPENSFTHIQQHFVQWAQSRSEVQAVLLVGSLARRNHPADHWSDLDLVVYTTYPQTFISDDRWLHEFGEVWAHAVDHTPRGDPEWFIFYSPGLKVDVLFVDIASLSGESLTDWVQHPDFSEVFSRGIRALADKTTSHGNLPEIHNVSATRQPTQAELTELVNRFWLSAVRAARLIYRNDLWRARQACDDDMKLHLLRMLEWHALSIHGPDYDVWYDGRFLAEWADPQAVSRLPACFGNFERTSLTEAFYNTLDLFEDLGGQTCANLGLEYPLETAGQVRAWLQMNLSLTK